MRLNTMPPTVFPDAGNKATAGFVLPLILTILGCLLLLWAAFFAMAQTSVRLVRLETNRRQASWAARAGALHALVVAQKHPPLSPRVLRLASTAADPRYRVTVTFLGNTADIRAIGIAGRQQTSCRWHIRLAHPPHGLPFPYPFR